MSSIVLALALWLDPESIQADSPEQAIFTHLAAVIATWRPHR